MGTFEYSLMVLALEDQGIDHFAIDDYRLGVFPVNNRKMRVKIQNIIPGMLPSWREGQYEFNTGFCVEDVLRWLELTED